MMWHHDPLAAASIRRKPCGMISPKESDRDGMTPSFRYLLLVVNIVDEQIQRMNALAQARDRSAPIHRPEQFSE